MKHYTISRLKLITLIPAFLILNLSMSLNTLAQDQINYQVYNYNVQYDPDLENDRAAILALLNSKLNSIISSGTCDSGYHPVLLGQIENYLTSIPAVHDIAQSDAIFMVENSGSEPQLDFEEFEDALYDESLVPGLYLPLYSSLNTNYEQALNEWLNDIDTCEEMIDIAEFGAVVGIGRAEVGKNQFYLTLIISEAWQIVKPGQKFTNTIKSTSSQDRQLPIINNILMAPKKNRLLKFNMN